MSGQTCGTRRPNSSRETQFSGANNAESEILILGSADPELLLLFVVFLTLTDPLRIQPWSQDRRNQTKSNRESEVSRESRQKRTDKKVASKVHRRDKIENTNKNTQTVETT